MPVGTALVITTAATAINQDRIAGKQEKAAEKASDIAGAVEAEGASRSRRAAASEALVARRQVENTAAVSGFSGTAVSTSVNDIQNKVTGGVSDINFAQQSNAAINNANRDVTKAGRSSLASIFLNQAGGVAAGALGSAAGASMSK